MTSPVVTMTKQMPTVGVIPRPSVTAQMTSWPDSVRDEEPLRDLWLAAVAGRPMLVAEVRLPRPVEGRVGSLELLQGVLIPETLGTRERRVMGRGWCASVDGVLCLEEVVTEATG
jgi:hypothetical protein